VFFHTTFSSAFRFLLFFYLEPLIALAIKHVNKAAQCLYLQEMDGWNLYLIAGE